MTKFAIGCHVSIAGGIWNAPKNAFDLGCETFQIFTRSPRGGPAAELTPEIVKNFKAEMEKYGFIYSNGSFPFAVHCPYYINFASANKKTYHGSISIVRGELERTSLLGGGFVMFHTGSAKDLGKKEAIIQAKAGLKKVLEGYKGKALLLIEIAAGAGEVIGDSFEEIAELMKDIKKYPGFGGVCFDTQHAFASGYDLKDDKAVKATFERFDQVIGLEWLKMSHINDSKVELGARKDRHEHINEGKIGEKGFGAMLKFISKNQKPLTPRPLSRKGEGESNKVAFGSFPLILETEHDKVKADIKLLKKIRDTK